MLHLNGLRFVLLHGLFIKDVCTAYRILFDFFPWGGVGGAYLKGALIRTFTVTAVK